jgi:predicted XRE-type DNA-binding protein
MTRYQQLLEMIKQPGAACIEWPYCLNSHGYGHLIANGRRVGAHREALQEFDPAPNGKICSVKGEWVSGDKLDAAHGPCHNPQCINPLHLSWLTRAENLADRKRDGTEVKGEHNGMSKLDAEEVAEIRAKYAIGQYLQRELAEQYGVDRSQISYIVNGKCW